MSFAKKAGPNAYQFFITTTFIVIAFGYAQAADWSPTGSMNVARGAHTATLIPNGKVLIVGGGACQPSGPAASELYDPGTGTFSFTGSANIGRWAHRSTLLSNGKVLVTGGGNSASVFNSAELYDPSSGSFSNTGSMGSLRWGHEATLLPNGKVLVTGGVPSGCVINNSAELYDPATGTFSFTGPMNTARYGHQATLLPNGKVLIVGGVSGQGCRDDITNSSELYDPATGTFSYSGSLSIARTSHTATLLSDGKVLVAGGMLQLRSGGIMYQFPQNTAEIYDPATGTFANTGSMGFTRWGHTSTLLPNNKVLVVAGANRVGYPELNSAELFDPAAGTFSPGESMGGPVRQQPTATLLPNGEVLIAGGTNSPGSCAPLINAELYVGSVPSTPPLANAGASQTVHAGSLVTLDGGGSSDPGGNVPLTYQWGFVSRPGGSTASISNSTVVNPTFTPDLPGDYIIQLVVTNSRDVTSLPATVSISTTNTPPVASAGPDQSVTLIGSIVRLDGTQSYDLDGDAIAFNWTLTSRPEGSTAELIGANTSIPNFIADVHGTYVAQLAVSDPWVSSPASSVTISFENVKPVADPGASQSVPIGVIAFLAGSGNDANGDPLTYSWSLVSRPPNSIASITSPANRIASMIPDLPGAYVVQLSVNDGFVNSDPATIQIQGYATESAAIASIQEAQASIAFLPGAVFKNANMKNALTNKLNAAIANVDAGLYADALAQLRDDILGKTDGCAASGAPDKNDWIKTCAEQMQFYSLVQEAIWIVEGLQ